MTTTRTLATGLAIAGAALAAPAAADAVTYCVNAPTCLGTQMATPQAALDAAELNGVADIVRIGPKAGVYTGGLSYSDPEQVTIIGAGASDTVLEISSAETAALLGNTSSRLEDVRIRYSEAASGLKLGGVARRVSIVHTGSQPDTYGLWLEDGGSFQEGFVSTRGGAVMSSANTGALVRDSYLSGRQGLRTLSTGDHLFASRVTVNASNSAVTTKGDVTLSNSVLRVGPSGSNGILAAESSEVIANHVTIVGAGSGTGAAVDSAGGTPASLRLVNSVIHGFDLSLEYLDQDDDLSVRYSALALGVVVDHGPGTVEDANNIDVPPAFVAPTAWIPNFQLLSWSGLIDAGDPGDVLIDDRDGRARRRDGDGDGMARTDIGAYEYQRLAPTAAFTVPSGVTAGQTVQLSGLPSSDPDAGDEGDFAYAWSFGDGATATSMSPSHAWASPGTYEVALTVTDPTGLSHTHTAQLTVAAMGGAGGGEAGDPAQPGQQGEGQPNQPGTAGDSTAPVISKLALRGRGARRHVRFLLSEEAAVTLRFKRRGARRARGLRLSARPGLNRVRFLRRLSLKRGSYTVRVRAVDAAGNASLTKLGTRLLVRRAAR